MDTTLERMLNWIALCLGIDMSKTIIDVQYCPTPTNPKHYVDVQFTVKDKSVEGLPEVDFRLLHALVLAFQPTGNVSVGVVEGWHLGEANLSIGLEGIYHAIASKSPADLNDFQTLAIKRLGVYRPYERPAIMHRDQGK